MDTVCNVSKEFLFLDREILLLLVSIYMLLQGSLDLDVIKMKAQRKTQGVLSVYKSKGKKTKGPVTIELSDTQPDVQIIEIIKFPLMNQELKMEEQTHNKIRNRGQEDINSLRVFRINHFFKRDGEIWFQVMIGRSDVMYRQPQLLPFSFLQEKYSSMLYNYLLSFYQSQAHRDV